MEKRMKRRRDRKTSESGSHHKLPKIYVPLPPLPALSTFLATFLVLGHLHTLQYQGVTHRESSHHLLLLRRATFLKPLLLFSPGGSSNGGSWFRRNSCCPVPARQLLFSKVLFLLVDTVRFRSSYGADGKTIFRFLGELLKKRRIVIYPFASRLKGDIFQWCLWKKTGYTGEKKCFKCRAHFRKKVCVSFPVGITSAIFFAP